MRTTIPRAQAILTSSTCTSHEMVQKLGVKPERIAVTPGGVDERFCPAAPDDVCAARKRFGLASPYVIQVGSINPRKNVARLVRAFARVRREHDLPHHLVLAGGLGWQYDDALAAIRESGQREAIHLLGRVSDEDVPLLMAGAECVAYPSRDEGFGLPVIEAMACGTPVLTSAISTLMELADGAALLVDPMSEDAIAAGLGRLLHDSELRARLREAGLRRAQQFQWGRVGEAAVAAYRRVARKCLA